MPCKLGLTMYRAQQAARGLIRRGGEPGDPARDEREAPEGGRGKSATSPGHLKRDAGARSARDFAPGRLNRPAPGPAAS
jgi:hypothetical protein